MSNLKWPSQRKLCGTQIESGAPNIFRHQLPVCAIPDCRTYVTRTCRAFCRTCLPLIPKDMLADAEFVAAATEWGSAKTTERPARLFAAEKAIFDYMAPLVRRRHLRAMMIERKLRK